MRTYCQTEHQHARIIESTIESVDSISRDERGFPVVSSCNLYR